MSDEEILQILKNLSIPTTTYIPDPQKFNNNLI